ncbi:MAG: TauD/TfdA family dioxygenase, partial [Alphaproteobacteria bacterium]|nr:TauD/TfdA family dioxygenase [Alphaproteobacteria bacterium]
MAEACAIDPGAAFAPPVLARLAALKKEHRVRFELHKAATLYAKEAPAFGGDTAFANQYLACASLSPGMRELLDGMQAKHTSAMPYGGESARFASVSRLVSPSPEDR